MLVFSTDFKYHVSEEPYAVDGKTTTRLESRTDVSIQTLIRMITEINEYLPDGWRMTKSANNFVILVCPRASRNFALTGGSYRIPGSKLSAESTLHIIDTVLSKDMVPRDEWKAYFRHVPLQKVTEEMRASVPETMQPNLYYFPDQDLNYNSPLFARQYERVLAANRNVQYHRVHPLTKAGTDPNVYCWVKWDVNGELTEVFAPDPRYHGDSYWKTPSINETEYRAEPSAYYRNYSKIVDEQLGGTPVPPEQSASAYEAEYKFIIPGDYNARTAANRFADIAKTLGELLISEIEPDVRTTSLPEPVEQVDTYFDDDTRSLACNGVSCRLRARRKETRVTVKAKQSNNPASGWYERSEQECVLSEDQKRALSPADSALNSTPDLSKLDVDPIRLLRTLVPDCVLKPVITVQTHRRVLVVRSGNAKAEVCFDVVWFISGSNKSDAQVEIEIESKGFPRDELRELAQLLRENVPDMVPSAKSKYERALDFADSI